MRGNRTFKRLVMGCRPPLDFVEFSATGLIQKGCIGTSNGADLCVDDGLRVFTIDAESRGQTVNPASAKSSMRASRASTSSSWVRPPERWFRRSNSAKRLLCSMPSMKCSRQ